MAVDDNWRLKRLATKSLTVTRQHAMTKGDGRKQHNDQPMTGESKSKAGIGGGGNGNSNGSGGGGSGQ